MLQILSYLTARKPALTLSTLAGITLVMFLGLAQPRYDVSVESFLTEEEIAEFRYREFTRAFGEDNDVIFMFRVDDAYSDESLAVLSRLGERLRELPNVCLVFSVADTISIENSGLIPSVQPLVPDVPLSVEQRNELKETVQRYDIYRNKVVSEDGRYAGLEICLIDPAEPGMDLMAANAVRREQMEEILGIVDEEVGDTPYNVAGWPFIKLEMNKAVLNDLLLIAPAIGIVSMLFLWIGFRSFYALIIGVASVANIVTWTISTFFLAGRTVNLVSALLPSLIMAISFAQLVFIIAQFRRSSGDGEAKIRETIAKAAPPCFLGALTTSAGFLSLTATGIGPIQEFGLFAAVGISYAFIISILAVPSLLRLRPNAIPPLRKGFSTGILTKIASITKHGKAIGIVSVVLVIIAAFGIAQVRTETNLRSFFSADHPVNEGMRSLKTLFGATNAIDFYIEAVDGGVIAEEELRQLQRLRDEVAEMDVVVDSVGVLSVGQLLTGSEEAFIASMADEATGPVRTIISTIPAFSQQFSADGTAARITFLLTNDAAEYSLTFAEEVQTIAGQTSPDLRVTATGQGLLLSGMSKRLLGAQITSVGLILLFVTVIVAIVNRSLLLGLLSIVPNAAPILLTLGTMGWLGVPLNTVTIMVSSIAIGIAVDDTIHFIHYLRRRQRESGNLEASLDETLLAKGRPIAFTSLLLASAFMTHTISSFQPTVFLGLLSALTMLFALVGDLLLLPVLLRATSPALPAKAATSTDTTP